MDRIEYLVEQQGRDFAARLRHVDRLLASAHQAAAYGEALVTPDASLRRLEFSRQTLAQEFAHYRRTPPDDLRQVHQAGQMMNAALRTMSIQLEQLLTEEMSCRRPSQPK